MHGGKIPAVLAAADRRAEIQRYEEQVQRQVGDQGPVLPLGPDEVIEQLLKNVALVVRWRDVLEGRVRWLEGIRYTSAIGTEQIRAEVVLWERALALANKTLMAAAELHLEERQVRLAQRQADLVIAATHRILGALALTPEQEALVPVVVPREFRRIAGDQ